MEQIRLRRTHRLQATFETARLRTHRLQANLSTHILQSIRVVCVYISVSVSVGRQDFFIFVGTGRTCSALWILEDRPRALENCGVCLLCSLCVCRQDFFMLVGTEWLAPGLGGSVCCVCILDFVILVGTRWQPPSFGGSVCGVCVWCVCVCKNLQDGNAGTASLRCIETPGF